LREGKTSSSRRGEKELLAVYGGDLFALAHARALGGNETHSPRQEEGRARMTTKNQREKRPRPRRPDMMLRTRQTFRRN